jgi:transcriptional regulator with GAF, ATPase, and Fis domain
LTWYEHAGITDIPHVDLLARLRQNFVWQGPNRDGSVDPNRADLPSVVALEGLVQERDERGEGSLATDPCQDELNVVAHTLAKVARELENQGEDPEETLLAIVEAAVRTVPAAEFASITQISSPHQLSTRLATTPIARKIDAAQYESREGPCLEAAFGRYTVRVHDFAEEQRWARFSPAAERLGVRSMLAVQLFVEREDLGALNMFSGTPGAFDAEAENIALLFAAHASVAMAGAKREAHMRVALGSRDLIGQAKGMLMERYKIEADVAFKLLVRVSQQSNVKVVVIAEQLARTGRLDY